jgi:hypothetical protein
VALAALALPAAFAGRLGRHENGSAGRDNGRPKLLG